MATFVFWDGRRQACRGDEVLDGTPLLSMLIGEGSVASIFARFCPLPFLTGSPQHRGCGVPHGQSGQGSARVHQPLAEARTDVYRADEWCPAGPCFDELGLDVVDVVFEVKLWVSAVEHLRLGLGHC
jgi:hypothetical protein